MIKLIITVNTKMYNSAEYYEFTHVYLLYREEV